jgi:hypothetical protein
MLDEPAARLDAPFETSPWSTSAPAPSDWRHAHEELSRLARARAHLDWEEGVALLSAERSGAHLQLGYATFAEYVGRLFRYSPRSTAERLRVAEALNDLPELAQALGDGAITWSALRELSRVAVAENEHAWLQIAQGRTLRQIEELVSGHQLGDAPGEPSGVPSLTHVLRWEVSAEVFSIVREAMAELRRDAGEPLDDDAALLLMARQVLGGPADAGRANYQVALTICEECRRGWQQGAGVPVIVGPEIVEMACCDAQHLGRIPAPIGATADMGHAANGCSDAHVGVGSGSAVADSARVAEQVERTTGATASRGAAMHADQSISHVGSASVPKSSPPTRAARARHGVPPAVRREVMRRDGGRCVVPGCRHGVLVDLHHIELRSEGAEESPTIGRHRPSNPEDCLKGRPGRSGNHGVCLRGVQRFSSERYKR